MLDYKYIKIFFILFVVFIVKTSFSFSSKQKVNLNREETSGLAYRTTLFDNIDRRNTEIKPDAYSTPLRVSKEELGRFTWAKLYPCSKCSKHFAKILEKFPFKTTSRCEVILSLCEIHNEINKKLNKSIFDCALAPGYWGGDYGCSAN